MKPIAVGIAGYGGIAKIHVLACQAMQVMIDNPTFQPVLHSVFRSKLTQPLPMFASTHTDWKQFLADATLQVVDICSPNFLHFEQAQAALEHGKAVYCEKPLALTAAKAMELANLAETRGLIQQVALMYRFMPAVIKARECIKSGALGEIIHFKLALYHKGYLNPKRPISWRQQKEYAGAGALMDLGIHMADLLRFLLGEIASVQAYLYTHFKERLIANKVTETAPVDVDEYALLNIKLAKGGLGQIEVSRITADLKETTQVEIFGTKGSLKLSDQDPVTPTIYVHGRGIAYQGDMAPESEFAKFHQQAYPNQKLSMGLALDMHFTALYNLFTNIVAGQVVHAETPTFREAALSQKILDLALLSHEQGNQWVDWDQIQI